MVYEQIVGMELFQGISQEAINCLNQMSVIDMNYCAGQIVSYFGDPLDHIFLILKGTLKTNEYTVEGKEIVSSYYNENDAFPFYLIYSDVHHLPYNIICHKNAKVLLLPVEQILN